MTRERAIEVVKKAFDYAMAEGDMGYFESIFILETIIRFLENCDE